MGKATGVLVLAGGLFVLYGAVTGTLASMVGALFGAKLRTGAGASSGSSGGGLAGAGNPVKRGADGLDAWERAHLGGLDAALGFKP